MNQAVLTLEFPEFLANITGVKKKNLNDYIRRTLAVELYREGKLSLGKAKELASLPNKWEMIRLLDSRGVPIDYSVEDAESDLDTLDTLLQ